MDAWLHEVFGVEATTPAIPLIDLVLRLLLALVFGTIVATIYRLTQRGDVTSSPTFVPTLVMLTVLLAIVTQVIGNSAALAFSLVGILSIVRFRTVVEDTRDTAFVIFAVVVGMATGVANYTVALTGLVIVGGAAIAMRFLPLNGPPRSDLDWTLLVRVSTGAGAASPWEDVLARYCVRRELFSTQTARQGAVLELTYRLRLKANAEPLQLLNELNRLEGIQNLELKKS